MYIVEANFNMPDLRKYLFLISICLSLTNHLYAQREAEEEDNLPFIPTKIDTTEVVEMDLKNVRILPFIAPSVSPEVGFMLVGGGLISFKLDKESSCITAIVGAFFVWL